MPRLAFTSDLHIDHHLEVIDLIAARVAGAVDALIVAGDVTPAIARLGAALAHLKEFVPRVIYVPGNHDLWCRPGTPDSRTRYLEALPEACAAAGADYLPSGPVVLDGVTLVGQTGWYDYSLRDPKLDVPLAAYERGVLGPMSWSDKQFVVWPGVNDVALTELMVSRLRDNLAAAPRDRPVWVVTHMLPFEGLVARRPLPWGFVNGFLGSAAMGAAIVEAVEDGVPVVRAISGHTHFRRETKVTAGGRTFLAETSPIGYPREIVKQGAGSLAAHVADRVPIVEVS